MKPLSRRPARVAVISLHTSPLDQPGTGDAGGLNVYVAETARRIGESGVAVDVYTRAVSAQQPRLEVLGPGVRVLALPAGPGAGARKEDLPQHVGAFADGVLGAAAESADGPYDIVHSHYWLSGQAGWLAAGRWSVPLIHTMHTMAKVKNRSISPGDRPEPVGRIAGEQHLVSAADRLIANTDVERGELIGLYGAAPGKVDVVHPGVDLELFTPGDRAGARKRLGWAAADEVLLFVGRLQPLKGPDVLIRAAAEMVARNPGRRDRLRVVVCGGLSGAGMARPGELEQLAHDLGVGGIVEFLPPVGRRELADHYRAADLVAVPSHSESFGLVALEAQACGTPVVAAGVGGLTTAVADGRSGILVPGHDPARWAGALAAVLADAPLRQRLGAGAVEHVRRFSWDATAANTLEVYRCALAARGVPALQAAH